jgi:hypothetical protein
MAGGRDPLLSIMLQAFSTNVSTVFNIDPSGDTVSWYWVYVNNILGYFDFIGQAPFAMLIGEGPIGYGEVLYERGGDVGLLEFIAAYGIPMAIVFFIFCVGAMVRAAKSLKYGGLDENEKMYLVFSFAVLAFILLAFAHYDIFFEKSIIAFFYLALGLVRRYGYGQRMHPRRESLLRRVPITA